MSFFQYRVYVKDSKLTDEVKAHLKDTAELHPYGTSNLLADIKTEAAGANAKIWVLMLLLLISLYLALLRARAIKTIEFMFAGINMPYLGPIQNHFSPSRLARVKMSSKKGPKHIYAQ